MKISIHSLYWDNGRELAENNKKVCDFLGLNVNYHNLNNFRHGLWMNEVLNNVDSDVIGFFDIDCIPTNKDIVYNAIEYCIKNDSFIGIAQASNHIPPYHHIFAAPAFFFITKNCYKFLGNPSFLETNRSDVAQEVSYIAEEKMKQYRILYPLFYEKPSIEGIWNLGHYGKYGIGTYFEGGIYHLYQGRFQNNVDLFKKRCQQIIDGTFTTENMKRCVEF